MKHRTLLDDLEKVFHIITLFVNRVTMIVWNVNYVL